jgi:hypothetical protein
MTTAKTKFLCETVTGGDGYGTGVTRRKFLKTTAVLGLAAEAGLISDSVGAVTPVEMPTIRLGDFRVSRLILGSNPFWGYWHKNPRKPQDYTQAARKSVMDAAADLGITAVWTPAYREWIDLWTDYKTHGGKLPTWIGQPDGYKGVSVEDQITACYKNGGKAVCVQGANVDSALEKQEYDKLRKWLDLIKGYGLPAGLASHQPASILKAQELGLPADFYHLTLGIPDGFAGPDRDKTLDTVKQIDKPMVVFKVLGAGRFAPKEAFPYVLKAIRRKDGVCVGVDNPEQLAENTTLVRSLTNGP